MTWSWYRMDLRRPEVVASMDEPEPMSGWIPILVQSDLPMPIEQELVIQAPSPTELTPLPFDTVSLVATMNKENRANAAMGDEIEKLLLPEAPKVRYLVLLYSLFVIGAAYRSYFPWCSRRLRRTFWKLAVSAVTMAR